MAEQVKITFEIDGITQSVSSVAELEEALKGVDQQSSKTQKNMKKVGDEAKKVGENAVEAGANMEASTKIADEAFGGLGTKIKEVGGGIKQLGTSAVSSFKSAVMGASAMGKALIATGIGAIVVALGLIAAYWDDIVGAISGVSADQAKLLEDTKKTAQANQENLDATLASENSLRLAGKSEKEIRDLKIQQTNETIASLETQLAMQQEQAKAQVAALERNKTIAQNVIRFLTAPVTILLKAVDLLTAGLKQVGVISESSNLEESFSGGIAGLIFDPEAAKEEGDKTDKEVKAQIAKLKNTRDGYLLQGQADAKKANDDAKLKAEERAKIEKELLDELARLQAENIADAQAKALALLELQRQKARQELIDKGASNALLLELDKNYAMQAQGIKDQFAKEAKEKQDALDKEAADKRAIVEEALRQVGLDSIDDAYARSREELRIQEEADMERLRLAGATADELAKIHEGYVKKNKKVDEEEAKFKKELAKATKDGQIKAGIDTLSQLGEIMGEGSIAAKAAAIAQTTIDTYASATAAYKSVVGIPFVGPALAPVAAGVAVAAGLMSIKKIVATKVPGEGGGGGGGGTPSVPSVPTFDPNAALASNAASQTQTGNVITSAEQTGAGSGVIKAFVVSSDLTSQQEKDKKINDLARL